MSAQVIPLDSIFNILLHGADALIRLFQRYLVLFAPNVAKSTHPAPLPVNICGPKRKHMRLCNT
jgi:hypothetical protein